MVARDEQLMDAVCDVAVQYGVPGHVMAGAVHEQVARRRGVCFVSEFYVDPSYRADSSLVPRRPSAAPPEVAVARGRMTLTDSVADADTGERVPVRMEGIRLHSDTPRAVNVAIAVRRELDSKIKWIRLKRKGPLMAEHTVRSPLPGVFYRSPSPTEPPFVEVGSSVTADETIGLIEIMKQFAEVKAGADGSLTAFAVEHEATVNPGDPIATIDAG